MKNYLPTMHVRMDRKVIARQAAGRNSVECKSYTIVLNTPFTDWRMNDYLIDKYFNTNGFVYNKTTPISFDKHELNKDMKSREITGDVDIFKYTLAPVEYNLGECKTVYDDMVQDGAMFKQYGHDLTAWMNFMVDTDIPVYAFVQETSEGLRFVSPGELWDKKIAELKRRVRLYAILGIEYDSAESGFDKPKILDTGKTKVIQKLMATNIKSALASVGFEASDDLKIDEATDDPVISLSLTRDFSANIKSMIKPLIDNVSILPEDTIKVINDIGGDPVKLEEQIKRGILNELGGWFSFDMLIKS